MHNRVVIFGNKAVASEVFNCFRYMSNYEVVAFVVENEYVDDAHTLFDLPVVASQGIERLFPPAEHVMFVALGYVDNNRRRARYYEWAKQLGYRLLTFVNPSAITFPTTILGDNCFLGHQCSIAANAIIGNDVIIGNHCTIAHDVSIDNHCFLSNNVAISGHVKVGKYCYLGTNCTIRNNVTIAERCVIGAGALILENTEPGGVYLGAAATPLPISSDELQLG